MISFIVPAYKEERLLGRTLLALHGAARAVGDPYELIVVDDASPDGTALTAEAHGARVIRVANRRISATRNAGARQAKGQYLFFVDADTVVTEAAVKAAVQALRNGAVGGGALVRFDGRIPIWAAVLQRVAALSFRLGRLASGCFLFCTHEAFTTVGGFDETLFGSEEIAMSKALKRRGRFVVLPHTVTTSGRKLRAHSGWELIRVMGGLALRGSKSVQSRQGMEIWYEGRREDPDVGLPL